MSVHLLSCLPVSQVSVVCEDGNRDLCSCYMGSEAFECFQDTQEFSFIDVIVAFGWGEGAGVVGNWTEHGLECSWIGFSLL